MTTLEAISHAASDINELECFDGEFTIQNSRYRFIISYENGGNADNIRLSYERKYYGSNWRKVGGIDEVFNEELFIETVQKMIREHYRYLEIESAKKWIEEEEVNYYDPWKSGATTDKYL